MRLVAVSPTGLLSGAETVLIRLLEAARERSWEVSCAAPPGPLEARLRDHAIAVVPVPELKLPPGPVPLAMARALARWARAAGVLRRHLRVGDVVLVNGLLALPAVTPYRRRCRVVWLVHDVVVRRDRLALLRLFGRTAELAVAVSDATAVPLRAAGIKTTVVRNGTPWPVEVMAGRPAPPPVIGCAALLTSWKGQDVLLEAVSRMRHREAVTVELMGGQGPKDGPFVELLRRRAARPDLAGRIEFLGNVADPLARMRTWTVGVSASVDPEAGPLATLEAMSIGLPMVGPDHGGTPEVLTGAGLLVPPRDPEAMADALDRLVEDPRLWDQLHAAGPEKISGGLTLEGQIRRLMDAIDGH